MVYGYRVRNNNAHGLSVNAIFGLCFFCVVLACPAVWNTSLALPCHD
jgi:hypothetical protein